MVKTVRIDKKTNYLIDSKTGKIIERYDPNNPDLKLVIKLDNSMLKIDAANIKTEYGGQVVVIYNDDKFIIDDGYQNILTKAGYIVYKNYDSYYEEDKNNGISIRENNILNIASKLENIVAKYPNESIEVSVDRLEAKAVIDSYNYIYTVVVNTVDDIVLKNNRRKDNSLSFYPFDKTMDRYGTVYLSIFAQKKHKVLDPKNKYLRTTSMVVDLLSSLGSDYHYVNQTIKRRVINWNSI